MSYTLAAAARSCVTLAIALLAWALGPDPVHGQTNGFRLEEELSFSRVEVMALARGRTVVRIPKAHDSREVMVTGAIGVRAPLDFIVECFRDPEWLFPGDGIAIQAGLFRDGPSLEDLDRLSLPRRDLEALRDCQVGDCKVKLTRDQLEAVKTIDRDHPEYVSLARDRMVRALLGYLDAYRTRGNSALPVYHDKSKPLSAAEDFAILHGRSREYLVGDPGMIESIDGYPHKTVGAIESLFFWMVEDFGLRPVTSLNHMMISTGSAGADSVATIAIKQIYASHYFQSSIRVVILRKAVERSPARQTYLVLYAGLRFDTELGSLKRHLVGRELEYAWRLELEALRDKIEARRRETRVVSK